MEINAGYSTRKNVLTIYDVSVGVYIDWHRAHLRLCMYDTGAAGTVLKCGDTLFAIPLDTRIIRPVNRMVETKLMLVRWINTNAHWNSTENFS